MPVCWVEDAFTPFALCARIQFRLKINCTSVGFSHKDSAELQ
jgi:hypothetical protein